MRLFNKHDALKPGRTLPAGTKHISDCLDEVVAEIKAQMKEHERKAEKEREVHNQPAA